MITTWSAGHADLFMPETILTELSALIRRHPWWRARTRLVMAILRRHAIFSPTAVLDAGCGWGVTLEALEEAGYRATGLDVSRQALERLDRPGRPLIEADLTRPLDTAGGSIPSFDAVLALDVIEHLDDDQAVLATLAQLVKPGGIMVVSVPALAELFSDFDRVQGHRRRYHPEDLTAAFDHTGMVIDQIFWWGSWLVPLFRARRKSSAGRNQSTPTEIYRHHLSLPPWPIPNLFRAVFAWEQEKALRGRTKTGTSLVAVARKPGTTDQGTNENRNIPGCHRKKTTDNGPIYTSRK